jgi:putative ABC transport system ATP-binding protein
MVGACLALEHVRRAYGRGAACVQAVREASFTVRPGELVAVVGPSGSGKSTLLAIVGGLLRPDAGRVWIVGTDVYAAGEARRAALRATALGFVFQGFNLLRALTARENVAVPLALHGLGRAAARARAEASLAEVGIAGRAGALPRDLSGGEQQRVAIARALCTDPALILADEPTANLDAANGALVIDILRRHVRERGAAAVVVTHDHRVLPHVDRVLRMDDGLVREEGDHAGLRAAAR